MEDTNGVGFMSAPGMTTFNEWNETTKQTVDKISRFDGYGYLGVLDGAVRHYVEFRDALDRYPERIAEAKSKVEDEIKAFAKTVADASPIVERIQQKQTASAKYLSAVKERDEVARKHEEWAFQLRNMDEKMRGPEATMSLDIIRREHRKNEPPKAETVKVPKEPKEITVEDERAYVDALERTVDRARAITASIVALAEVEDGKRYAEAKHADAKAQIDHWIDHVSDAIDTWRGRVASEMEIAKRQLDELDAKAKESEKLRADLKRHLAAREGNAKEEA